MIIHLWAPGFTPSDGGIQAYSNEVLMAFKKNHGISSVRAVGRGKSRALFALKAVILAVAERPDVIFCTHRNFIPLAVMLKKFLRVKIILSLHGIESWNMPVEALYGCDLLLPVSRFTSKKIPDTSSIPIEILPNTFDEERFVPGFPPAKLRKKYCLQENQPVLLTVGRLDEREAYKGQDRVIESLPSILREYPDCKYLIVGDGSDRVRLEQLAQKKGVFDSVIFAGFIEPSELADHYRLCDLYVMPSTQEGFGIAYLEALGCGKPVIAGNVDGSSEPLRDGELGTLINPGSISELTTAILRLLRKNSALTQPTPEFLQEKVRLYFGRTAFRHRLEEILSSIKSCAE